LKRVLEHEHFVNRYSVSWWSKTPYLHKEFEQRKDSLPSHPGYLLYTKAVSFPVSHLSSRLSLYDPRGFPHNGVQLLSVTIVRTDIQLLSVTVTRTDIQISFNRAYWNENSTSIRYSHTNEYSLSLNHAHINEHSTSSMYAQWSEQSMVTFSVSLTRQRATIKWIPGKVWTYAQLKMIGWVDLAFDHWHRIQHYTVHLVSSSLHLFVSFFCCNHVIMYFLQDNVVWNPFSQTYVLLPYLYYTAVNLYLLSVCTNHVYSTRHGICFDGAMSYCHTFTAVILLPRLVGAFEHI
jgi:hypothetical protein